MPRLIPRTGRGWSALVAGVTVAGAGTVAALLLVTLRGSSQTPLALRPSAAASPVASVDPSTLAGTWTVGSGSGFVSVHDDATMEFDLHLRHR